MHIYEQFTAARHDAKLTKKAEIEAIQHGRDPHGVYRQTLSEYQDDFRDVLLDDETLQGIISKRKITMGKVYVLDPFSEGNALRNNLEIDGGVAVGLNDGRLDHDKDYDQSHNIEFIEGDLLSGLTTHKIKDYLKRQNPSVTNFDFIFCNPYNGWQIGQNLEDIQTLKPELQYLIANNFWNLLNPNGGEMFIKFGSSFFRDTWLERLKESGVSYQTDKFNLVFRFIKDVNSPKNLPRIH